MYYNLRIGKNKVSAILLLGNINL